MEMTVVDNRKESFCTGKQINKTSARCVTISDKPADRVQVG
jgi:hypothetical protein